MCVVCLLHLFLQQELDTFNVEWNNHYIRKLKKSQISWISDELFSTPHFHGYLNCLQEILLEETDTLLKEYENGNRKNILSDAKEILNDHDSTLVEYFDYAIQEKQLNCPPSNWKKTKIIFEKIIDCAGH